MSTGFKNMSTRNGFSMLELSIGLFILGIVLVSVIKGLYTTREAYRFQQELDFYYKFDKAVSGTFEQITNTFEPYCSAINSTTQNGWGWGHTSCNVTSPFPIFTTSNGGGITYQIQWGTLAANEQVSLEGAIVEAFAPYCAKVSRGANDLVLRCSNLTGLTYNLGAGPVASAHTLGADISPLIVPQYTITYNRIVEQGNVAPQTISHNASLISLWQKRQNYSLEKINSLSGGLKTFYNSKLIAESQNVAPTGLNSVDDEFVPWYWEALGDTPASVSSALCTVSGGICTNLTNPAIWKTTTPHRAALMKQVIVNAGSSNNNLSTDGFGNMIRLLPISSLCTNSDLKVCTDTTLPSAPQIPADNYFAGTLKPPHTSVLFIDTCRNTTVNNPSYCRNYITY